MFKKIPIAGTKFNGKDIFASFKGLIAPPEEDIFLAKLSGYFGLKYVYLLNSGIASFFIILEALKEISPRKEVILPSYAPDILVLAILKAGLKPRFCDISLDSFGPDTKDMLSRITDDTLCVVHIHMFGIIDDKIRYLKKDVPDSVFVIEDCAQGMGCTVAGRNIGTFGDIGFFSFAKGKNMSLYEGGAIITEMEDMGKRIKNRIHLYPDDKSIFSEIRLFLKLLAFYMILNPYMYNMLYPMIVKSKDSFYRSDFKIKRISSVRLALGNSLIRNLDIFSKARYENGLCLSKALAGYDGLILPKISPDTRPAFNRFPVLFKDVNAKENIKNILSYNGVESMDMYNKPLHHIFDLGYKKNDFPNSNYAAEHILTIPTHPLVYEKDIVRIADIIKRNL